MAAHLQTVLIVAGHECEVEGCYARGYLEIDHCEVDDAKGGPAAWWNLNYKYSPCHIKKSQGWVEGPRDPVTGKRPLWPTGTDPDG